MRLIQTGWNVDDKGVGRGRSTGSILDLCEATSLHGAVVCAVGFGVWKTLHPPQIVLHAYVASATLDYKGYKVLLAPKRSLDLDGDFLVVGAQMVQGNPLFNATLSVIPYRRLRVLEKKYGNFLYGKNGRDFPGAASVIDVRIVLESDKQKNEVQTLAQTMLVSGSRPVVALRVQGYTVEEVSKDNRSVSRNVAWIATYRSMDVLLDDYRTKGFERSKGRRIFRTVR